MGQNAVQPIIRGAATCFQTPCALRADLKRRTARYSDPLDALSHELTVVTESRLAMGPAKQRDAGRAEAAGGHGSSTESATSSPSPVNKVRLETALNRPKNVKMCS
jgi:hypothetical protein